MQLIAIVVIIFLVLLVVYFIAKNSGSAPSPLDVNNFSPVYSIPSQTYTYNGKSINISCPGTSQISIARATCDGSDVTEAVSIIDGVNSYSGPLNMTCGGLSAISVACLGTGGSNMQIYQYITGQIMDLLYAMQNFSGYLQTILSDDENNLGYYYVSNQFIALQNELNSNITAANGLYNSSLEYLNTSNNGPFLLYLYIIEPKPSAITQIVTPLITNAATFLNILNSSIQTLQTLSQQITSYASANDIILNPDSNGKILVDISYSIANYAQINNQLSQIYNNINNAIAALS